jgi:hypothetical protein
VQNQPSSRTRRSTQWCGAGPGPLSAAGPVRQAASGPVSAAHRCALRCARDDGNAHALRRVSDKPSSRTRRSTPSPPRHPGRAAACNDAAQIRDLSPLKGLCAKPHQIPCLQRIAARCAAHGMTGMRTRRSRIRQTVIPDALRHAMTQRRSGTSLRRRACAPSRTRSRVCSAPLPRCAAHGMTGLMRRAKPTVIPDAPQHAVVRRRSGTSLRRRACAPSRIRSRVCSAPLRAALRTG